jgi:membrane-associated phospholipid phosphatase
VSDRSDVVTVFAGVATVAGTAALARAEAIHPTEERLFQVVNRLPAAALPPLFAVMQSGALAASFVAAGAAQLAGRRRLAVTLAGTGTAVWGACKVIKRAVGRGRPSAHVDGVTTRGPKETGLGFPSGHSAVVFTLASLVSPYLPPLARPAVWGVAVTTSAARMYVGAHLPLDIVGGAAVGLTAASLCRLAGAG